MKSPLWWEGSSLFISVRVQPRASRDELLVDGDRLRLRITAPPVDGAANAHLQRTLAKLFGVANGRVEIVRGLTGREKTIRILQPTVVPANLIALNTESETQKPLKK